MRKNLRFVRPATLIIGSAFMCLMMIGVAYAWDFEDAAPLAPPPQPQKQSQQVTATPPIVSNIRAITTGGGTMGKDQFVIFWDMPHDPTSQASQYVLQRKSRTGGGSWANVQINIGAVDSARTTHYYTNDSLGDNRCFDFRVQGKNTSGTGPWRVTTKCAWTFDTGDGGRINAPNRPNATVPSSDNTKVNIGITRPITGSSAIHYQLARRPGGCTSTGYTICLLYTSPSPRDRQKSRMPSSA